jgi:hypothetical protein
MQLTKQQTELLNRAVKGTWVQTPQGINIEGTIYLNHFNLTVLPVIFNTIHGNFCCYSNNLTTLNGAPKTIHGDFDCSWNKLTTLDGAPTTINGNFDCSNNQLTTLNGAPIVKGQFHCDPKHHQEPQYKLWQLKQKLMRNHP